jgi:hypothetical protein
MPETVKIDYLQKPGEEPLFLLTDSQRLRLEMDREEGQSRYDLLLKAFPETDGEEPPETVIAGARAAALDRLSSAILQAQADLLNDDLLRQLYREEVRTAVYEIPDLQPGSSALRLAVRTGAKRKQWDFQKSAAVLGEATPELTAGEATLLLYEAAFEALNPARVSGWEGEPPYALQQLVGEACHRKLFPEAYRDEVVYQLLKAKIANAEPLEEPAAPKKRGKATAGKG